MRVSINNGNAALSACASWRASALATVVVNQNYCEAATVDCEPAAAFPPPGDLGMPDRRWVCGLLRRLRITWNDQCMSLDERFTYELDSDCAYFELAPSVADDDAVE
jgi:hypothetical protein